MTWDTESGPACGHHAHGRFDLSIPTHRSPRRIRWVGITLIPFRIAVATTAQQHNHEAGEAHTLVFARSTSSNFCTAGSSSSSALLVAFNNLRASPESSPSSPETPPSSPDTAGSARRPLIWVSKLAILVSASQKNFKELRFTLLMSALVAFATSVPKLKMKAWALRTDASPN